MSNIVTDYGVNYPWKAYKNGNNPFTITATNAVGGGAFDFSNYVFVLNIRKIGGSTNVLQLTEGNGITNGGASGILTIVLTQEQASTTLKGYDFFWELSYTVNSAVQRMFQGILTLSRELNPESGAATSLNATINLASTNINVAITAGGGVDINALRGESSVLSGTELTFNTYHKRLTKTIESDQTLSVAASGNIANSFITLTTSGDGEHTLSFPAAWIMSGDSYNADKLQRIILFYDGTYIEGVITTLDDAPDITLPVLDDASISNVTPSILDLFFSEAVSIDTNGWSVSASGGAVTIDSIESGEGTSTPKFVLSRAVANGETVTISYNPATGATADTSDNELAIITNAVVTNNVSTTPVLLYDDFSAATLNTTKWTETNPSDGVTIEQTGGRLRFTGNPASAVASTNTNYVASNLSFNQPLRVFRVSTFKNAASANQAAAFKVFNAGDVFASARAAIISKNSSGKAVLSVWNGSAATYSFTTTINWDANLFKIVVESDNEIKFYYYNTGWAQLGTTQTFDLGGAVKVFFGANSSASDSGSPNVEFDALYVTGHDYSTSIPV